MRPSIYGVALFVAFVSLCLSAIGLSGREWITFQTPSSSPLPFMTHYGLFKKCDAGPLDLKEDHVDWHCRAFPLRSLDCRKHKRKPDGVWTTRSNDDGMKRARAGFNILMGLRPSNDFDDDDEEVVVSEDVEVAGSFIDEKFGFCELWRTAGYLVQISIALCIATMICSLVILLPPFAGRKRREEGWKVLAGLIALNVAAQCTATALITHLYNKDNRFWGGSRLGASFIVSIISWSINVILLVALVALGVTKMAHDTQGYTPIPSSE